MNPTQLRRVVLTALMVGMLSPNAVLAQFEDLFESPVYDDEWSEAKLKETSEALDVASASLEQSKQRVNAQATEIAALRNCLSGMSHVLDFAMRTQWAFASSLLTGVQASCNDANRLASR